MKYHLPVLLQEVSDQMKELSEEATLIDATIGEGGHSALLLESFPSLRCVGVDADARILERARVRLHAFVDRVTLVHNWYDDFFASYPMDEKVDIILFDLAISTYHYSQDDRGFSFDSDDIVDMRLDISAGDSAATMLTRMSERKIRDMLYTYGEDPFSRRIAQKIVQQRKEWDRKAKSLATLVRSCYPPQRRFRFPHPATRTFQALRIVVNDELSRLERTLHLAIRCLKTGGRIMVITFHSLEDRIVKHFFRQYAGFSEREDNSVSLEILTKKPIRASAEEIQRNPSSRSAKLRVAQRLA